MEIILYADDDNYKKIREKLLTDEIVNRASIIFKEAKQFGMDSGYICIVTGTEERCNRALELARGEEAEGEKLIENEEVKELAKEITGSEKEEILKKIKEDENKAIEGFGGIFG